MENEKKSTEVKMESPPEQENPATPDTPDRTCDVRCTICNSKYLKEIHDLRNAGHNFDDIVKTVHENLHSEISKSALSRHFKNYQTQQNLLTAKIMNGELIEQATKQAVHSKKLVGLIDSAFLMISEKIKAGTLFLDVSDLDKLIKLRYQIMNGEGGDESDVMAIFQRASNKYGLNLEQGVLFKKTPLPSSLSLQED